MKKQTIVCIIMAVALGLSFAVCQAGESKETVSITAKEGIGKFLVGSNGRVLYHFKKDAVNTSTCYGVCAERWPIYCYSLEEISVGSGLSKSDFGTIRRTDDQEQLTYKGMPLYRFGGDKVPFDTTGHGVNGVWYLVSP